MQIQTKEKKTCRFYWKRKPVDFIDAEVEVSSSDTDE